MPAEQEFARRIADYEVSRRIPPMEVESNARKLARAYLELEAELQAAQERLELIARNAESWHHDADARQRALNVIAAWARGGEIPESLLRNLRGQRTEEPSDG